MYLCEWVWVGIYESGVYTCVWICMFGCAQGVLVSLCAARTSYFSFCIDDPRGYSLYNFYIPRFCVYFMNIKFY